MGVLRSVPAIVGAAIPGWLTANDLNATPLLQADYVNGHYYHNGTVYANETSFNTALNGTKSGITRTIGPYVAAAATELLTNGTFDTDTTGWTADGSSLISQSGGELVVECNSGTNPGAKQTFSATVGKAYSYTGQARRGTLLPTSSAVGLAYNSSVGFIGSTTTSNATATSLQAIMGCYTGTTMSVFGRAQVSGKTGTCIFDNLSVKECLPFSSYTQGISSGRISARTPATISSTQCLLAFGADHATRQSIRIEYRTDNSVWGNVSTYAGSYSFQSSLGTVPVDTDFEVRWSCQGGKDFVMWIVGKDAEYAFSGAYPASGIIRIGKSASGETWTGSIYSITIYGAIDKFGNCIHTTGDSYMVGTSGDGNAFNTALQNAGRSGHFNGGGGTTADTQLGYLQAENPGLYNQGLVWWDGSANGVNTSSAADISAYLDYFDQGIALQNVPIYVIIPEMKAPGLPANWTRADNIRDAMVARWGATHVLDWRDVLTVDADGAVERQWQRTVAATAITAGEDCVIQSVGTTDFTAIGAASNTVGTRFTATGAGTGTGTIVDYAEGHLNATAMAAMATQAIAKLAAQGG